MFELLGVSAIMPFVQILVSPKSIQSNRFLMTLKELFTIQTDRELMLMVGIVIICLYLVKNMYMMLANYLQYSSSTKVQKELAVSMLHAYLSRPCTFFLDESSSDIWRGCDNDTYKVYVVLNSIL